MSKKKKQKKNKKSQVHNNNKNNQASALVQSAVLGSVVNEKETKLLTADEELVKLENKPVDLLDKGELTTETDAEMSVNEKVSTSEVDLKTDAEKFDTGIMEQESKLKHDLERDTNVTLESEAEHHSHINDSSNNFKPLLVGLILGALLMSWWL